jgi:predicted dehydrogenase
MYKSLVIGCGNIGALYDINNENILTHSKAFYNHPNFSLTVFDTNKELVKEIAQKYNCGICEAVTPVTLAEFDCISICTPTHTHLDYLEKGFEAKTKLILCEKPVSNLLDELSVVETSYLNHSSKVLVNYMRRFQPAYLDLRNTINDLSALEALTNISVRYQRGFINNCSHAFDTLEFLFGVPIELSGIKLHNKVHDHFETDPTVSLQASWNNTNFNILGLSNVKFSNFEIDIYFESQKISLQDSGNKIEVLKALPKSGFLQPLMPGSVREGALKNYMEPVIHHAYMILAGETSEDNFIESVNLNKRLLTYLKN